MGQGVRRSSAPDGAGRLPWLVPPGDPLHAPEHGERDRDPAQYHHRNYERRFHPVLPL